MLQPEARNRLDPKVVLRDVVKILEDMLSDWEGFEGQIGPDTLLVCDLACSSVEVVELAVTIQDHFDQPELPFHELLMTADGHYIDDLRVRDLVAFVSAAALAQANQRGVAQ